jgi:hypothetical protein
VFLDLTEFDLAHELKIPLNERPYSKSPYVDAFSVFTYLYIVWFFSAHLLRRRAHQRLATPKWADKEACRAFYKKAKELTEKTGIEYVVDHIDPLISNLVYGLHCENNLQVITRFDNTFKSNHFIPYRIDASGEKHFLF